jgi:hypothetical protein
MNHEPDDACRHLRPLRRTARADAMASVMDRTVQGRVVLRIR